MTNPNCDGSHCHYEDGEVRIYPLGAGGNLILCQECFKHENLYRFNRGLETNQPDNWPLIAWATAARYSHG